MLALYSPVDRVQEAIKEIVYKLGNWLSSKFKCNHKIASREFLRNISPRTDVLFQIVQTIMNLHKQTFSWTICLRWTPCDSRKHERHKMWPFVTLDEFCFCKAKQQAILGCGEMDNNDLMIGMMHSLVAYILTTFSESTMRRVTSRKPLRILHFCPWILHLLVLHAPSEDYNKSVRCPRIEHISANRSSRFQPFAYLDSTDK